MNKFGKFLVGTCCTVTAAGACVGVAMASNKDFRNDVYSTMGLVSEQKYEESQLELSETKESLSDSQETITTITREKEEIYNENNSLKTQLVETQQTVSVLTEQKTTLETEISQIQSSLSKETNEKRVLLSEFEQKTAELEQINSQLAESEARVAELEEELALKENISVTTGEAYYYVEITAKMSGSVTYGFCSNSDISEFRMLGAECKEYFTTLSEGINAGVSFITHYNPIYINYVSDTENTTHRVDETINDYDSSTCRNVTFTLKDAEGNVFDPSTMEDNTQYSVKIDNVVIGELSGDVLTNGSFDIVVTPVV